MENSTLAWAQLLGFISPFMLQGLVFFWDEQLHKKRGLPLWEIVGHPLDTFFTLSFFLFIVRVPFSAYNSLLLLSLGIISCFSNSKDEFIHSQICTPLEMWLHSLLFMLHPILLIWGGLWWYLFSFDSPQALQIFGLERNTLVQIQFYLYIQVVLIASVLLYQIGYWGFYRSFQKLFPKANP